MSALVSSRRRQTWPPFGKRDADADGGQTLPSSEGATDAGDPVECLSRIMLPPVLSFPYPEDGDAPAHDLPSDSVSRGPLTLVAFRDELDRVDRETGGLRVLLQQSKRELASQQRRQAAALREVELVEERLQYHSREEIRSVYIRASEAEMRTFMVSEQLDQIRAKLQTFERYRRFLRAAVGPLQAGVPTVDAPPDTPLDAPLCPAASLPAGGGLVLDLEGRRWRPLADETTTGASPAAGAASLETAPGERPPAVGDATFAAATAAEPVVAPPRGGLESAADEAATATFARFWCHPAAPATPGEAARYEDPALWDEAAGETDAVCVARLAGAASPAPPRVVRAECAPHVAQPDGSAAFAPWPAPGEEAERYIDSPPPARTSRRRRRPATVRIVPVVPDEAPPAAMSAPYKETLPESHMPEAPDASAPGGATEPERGVVVMGPRTVTLAFAPGEEPRGVSQATLGRIVLAQEEMAERVARQIQSGPVQSLMNLALEASLYEQMAQTSPAAAVEGLQHLRALVNTIVQEHAQALLALRPLGRGERSFIGAVRRLALSLSGQHQVQFEFLAPHGERALRPDLATAAFRIAQEALLNAAQHSRASLVLVTVDFSPDRLTVEVEDDGVGFDSRATMARAIQQETGGLMGMVERAELLGGWLRVESRPGKGTLVEFSVPFGPIP